MAVAVGSELPLAGLVGCSAYPHPNWVPPNQSPPLVLFHGPQDEVVPIQASRELAAFLQKNDLVVETFFFEGGHEIPIEIYQKLQLFILECMQKNDFN